MRSTRQGLSASTVGRAAQLLCATGALAAIAPAHALTAAQCAVVRNVSVPATTITAAAIVAAAPGVPEHCLVQGRVDAEIAFNLGLPSNWNCASTRMSRVTSAAAASIRRRISSAASRTVTVTTTMTMATTMTMGATTTKSHH